MTETVVDVAIVGGGVSGVYSGWVEGALQTAEQMLMDKFDLRSPDWLPMR